MKKTLSAWQGVVLLAFLFLGGIGVKAEGSKDLYPQNATGYRAVLRSASINSTAINNWPFPTPGTHYVYAKTGEIIALASSAQLSSTDSAIRLYGPNDTTALINDMSTAGQIPNRNAELAGPRLTDGGAGGYTPIYYTVPAGGTGIYRVEFVARGTGDPPSTILADASWAESNSSNSIYAWDISVINSGRTGFIKGRVYTNVFSLSTGTGSPGANGWNSIIYALTKDGYTYKVNNNGNNGMYFTFFINNNGFIGSNGLPLYKSLNSIDRNLMHDPRKVDEDGQITHKMFYNLPANDLPVSSSGAVPSGSTWLKVTPIQPSVSEIKVIGVEGMEGQVSTKGGYVNFNASVQGNYSIKIEADSPFVTRVLTGSAKAGANKVYWDGKDGSGVGLDSGVKPLKVTVQLQGAEVHFPYIDMEYNTKGTIIELLDNADKTKIVSDIVYWNDIDVTNGTGGTIGPKGRYSDPKNNSHLPPTNSVGISSNTNGHIWGQGATGTGVTLFGDNRSIDTWAFIKGEAITVTSQVRVLVADLAVTSLTADKTNAVPGDLVTFTVTVKNNGPDAANGSKFVFTLPAGFTGNSAVFNGNTCGTQTTAISYNSADNTYSAMLNLPNGCEVAYTITATAGAPGASSAREVKASVLRPNDVTDPDATNTNSTAPLGTAEQECANNGKDGVCNNIRTLALQLVCEVSSRTVNASNNVTAIYNLPATDVGYNFDITKLDNSFNLIINGTTILGRDIQFQNSLTPGINVKFEDNTEYEAGTPLIYTMTGSKATPIIRVVINANGTIKLFGSKISNGPLFPLVLKSGSFAPFTINTNAPNIIQITQERYDPTNIAGVIYGAKTAPCVCFDAANTTGTAADTQVGITTLQRAGAENGNWPMVRKSGHIALESNDKGFVITRMTTAQINAIPTPVDGMMVFDTTANCLKIHNGSTWKCFSTPACL